MSRFSDSFDPNGIGILILQHKGYDQKGFSLDLRGGLKAVRVLDRDDNKGGLGSWEYDHDSPGDLGLTFLWPHVPGKRLIPGWSFNSWPVIHAPLGTPTQAQGKCGKISDLYTLAPIADKDYNTDKRFKVLRFPSRPKRNGKATWPKFPYDWIGLAITTTEEHVQNELFISGDPRLVAVQWAGDPEMGTLVCDLGPDFRIDPERLARLQAFLRVVKNPKGCVDFFGQNTLAWNIGPSGCGDVRGGAVIDRPGVMGTQTVSASDRIIGMASQFESGPFDVG